MGIRIRIVTGDTSKGQSFTRTLTRELNLATESSTSSAAERRESVLSEFQFLITRVGNFIIRASGSDKQILCGSSVARAAPTISAVNKKKKKKKNNNNKKIKIKKG